MKEFEFTVILKGLSEISDDLVDALVEAGCDDCSPASSCGVARVHFDRAANSFEDAVRSAVSQVLSTGCQIERIEIHADAEMLKA